MKKKDIPALLAQVLRKLPAGATRNKRFAAMLRAWGKRPRKGALWKEWDFQMERILEPLPQVHVTTNGVRCEWCDHLRPPGCSVCYNARKQFEEGPRPCPK